jgi:hypothetical protein
VKCVCWGKLRHSFFIYSWRYYCMHASSTKKSAFHSFSNFNGAKGWIKRIIHLIISLWSCCCWTNGEDYSSQIPANSNKPLHKDWVGGGPTSHPYPNCLLTLSHFYFCPIFILNSTNCLSRVATLIPRPDLMHEDYSGCCSFLANSRFKYECRWY